MAVEIYGPHGETGPQGPRSINWINAAWAAATDYSVDDALEHNGTTYRVTADHTSAAATEPGVGVDWATVWAVVAEKGADGAGATDLDGLTDVDLTTTPPADGDGLFFDSASGLWLPEAPAAGGGGGGGLLARIAYSPASNETKEAFGTSLVAYDTTNLRVVFNAPASGNVVVHLEGVAYLASGASYDGRWGLLDGASQVGPIKAIIIKTSSSVHYERNRHSARFYITGLTPGNQYTFDWAAQSTAAGGTFRLIPGPATGYGEAIMEVWEA